MQSTVTVESLRVLLARAVDYAGLFPPASLGMRGAVVNYTEYITGPYSWMLGRFIVPVARLNEFASAADDLLPRTGESQPWRLSVLTGADARSDGAHVLEFNAKHRGRAVIDVCESRAESAEQVRSVAAALPGALRCFVEIPLQNEVGALAAAGASAGVGIKARTGGTTSDAFPRAPDLVRFLRAAIDHDVPFKLTAGLHHPLPGEYRLTYDPGASCGSMFGFLNVFLAAALLKSGGDDDQAVSLLGEHDVTRMHFEANGVEWNGLVIPLDEIAALRRQLTGFGSCSFAEPVDELTTLGLLA